MVVYADSDVLRQILCKIVSIAKTANIEKCGHIVTKSGKKNSDHIAGMSTPHDKIY